MDGIQPGYPEKKDKESKRVSEKPKHRPTGDQRTRSARQQGPCCPRQSEGGHCVSSKDTSPNRGFLRQRMTQRNVLEGSTRLSLSVVIQVSWYALSSLQGCLFTLGMRCVDTATDSFPSREQNTPAKPPHSDRHPTFAFRPYPFPFSKSKPDAR